REVADGPAAGERVGPQVVAGDPHRPARRRKDARHDAHRRRLAGAVRTEEPDDLALVDGERDATHGFDRPEALRDVLDFDHRPRRHGGHRYRAAERSRNSDGPTWSRLVMRTAAPVKSL